jgi:hypothetical protein
VTASLGAALTLAWTLLAVAGGATVGSIHVDPVSAAVGAGATALGATIATRRGSHELLVAPLAVVVMPVACALAVGGHTALPLIVGVSACLATVGSRWRTAGPSLVAGEVGVGLLLAGLVLARGDLHAGVLPVETSAAAALLAVAAGALIAASALGPDGEDGFRLLLVPGLVTGWVVAPRVDGVALVAAVLVAGAVALVPQRRAAGACAALAYAAVAVAAVGPARPAAALLAAAAVLLGAAGPMVWPAALPGAVAAALALAAGSASLESVAAGVAVAFAALALAATVRGGRRVERGGVPALALAAWLAVAPATWAWAGGAQVEHYQQGASRAVAAALLVSVVAWMTGQLRLPTPEWPGDGW